MKLAIAAVTVLVVSLLGVSFSLAGDLPVFPDANFLFDGEGIGQVPEDGQFQSRTAQQRAHQFRTQTDGPGPYFVDEDGDGLCDNCSGGLNASLTQTQTQAQRGFRTAGEHGPGPFYVDADGDGNCDNCAGHLNAYRHAKQYAQQNGFLDDAPRGPGPNFVDEDGDGVCDNCTGDGNMYQHSNGYQDGGPHGQGPNAMIGDGNCDGPQNQHGNPTTGGGDSSAGSNGNGAGN
jgi:hypothetical protein